MTSKLAAALRRATTATRAFNVMAATRLIQRALRPPFGERAAGGSGDDAPAPRKAARTNAAVPEKLRVDSASSGDQAARPAAEPKSRPPKRLRRPLGEVIDILRPSKPASGAGGKSGRMATGFARGTDTSLPAGASFTTRSFTCAAGTREFKLYKPSTAGAKPGGLIVMLHGCTQDPDDFALGTGMNAFAETHGLLVAYPAQTRAHNASGCWNWFDESHQLRENGEPAILAGLTRELVKEFRIQDDRVFVAGLSAGAAMAVIMGQTYPDLFRAVGAHSGLAYQSAGNVMSALAVMRGRTGARLLGAAHPQDGGGRSVRTIIFHGAADKTVHPSNGQRIFDSVRDAVDAGAGTEVAGTANGRRYQRTVVATGQGHPLVETWSIQGAGHAWSGGRPGGSYTDPKGPDASAEMVRFFLEGT